MTQEPQSTWGELYGTIVKVLSTLGLVAFVITLIAALATTSYACLYIMQGVHPPRTLYLVQGQVADSIAGKITTINDKVRELYELGVNTSNPLLLRLASTYWFKPLSYTPQVVFLFALPNTLIELFTYFALPQFQAYALPLPGWFNELSGIILQALADLWFINTLFRTAAGYSIASMVLRRLGLA